MELEQLEDALRDHSFSRNKTAEQYARICFQLDMEQSLTADILGKRRMAGEIRIKYNHSALNLEDYLKECDITANVIVRVDRNEKDYVMEVGFDFYGEGCESVKSTLDDGQWEWLSNRIGGLPKYNNNSEVWILQNMLLGSLTLIAEPTSDKGHILFGDLIRAERLYTKIVNMGIAYPFYPCFLMHSGSPNLMGTGNLTEFGPFLDYFRKLEVSGVELKSKFEYKVASSAVLS